MTTQPEPSAPTGRDYEANIAANLRRLRSLRGLSAQEVARGLTRGNARGETVDAKAVRRIEDGERRIRYNEAMQLAQVLGVEIGELVDPPALADQYALRDALDARDEAWNRFLESAQRIRAAQVRIDEIQARLGDSELEAAVNDWFTPIEGKVRDVTIARRIWFDRIRSGYDFESAFVREWDAINDD